MDDMTAERASTRDLLQLPPSSENADAKLNHLIVTLELVGKQSARAELSSDTAAEHALASRNASVSAMNSCLKVAQRYEPLTKVQRFVAVAMGSLTGGVVTTVAIWLLAFGGFAVMTSCLGK